MTGRIVAWLVIALMLAGGLWYRQQQADRRQSQVELTAPRPSFAVFPPPHRSPPKAREPRSLSRAELAQLSRRAPAESNPRQRLARARNLYHLVLQELESAQAGNGPAQHLIYLALDECRPFLRLDPRTALDVNERMLGALSDLSPSEREQWARDFGRCVDFAINDWRVVAHALGEDEPGADTEVASAWFQQAVQSGYPPALAERALRAGTLDLEARQASLRAALGSGHPEVYGACFLQQLGPAGELGDHRALAWLVLACRTGFDCRAEAPWYAGLRCAEGCVDEPPPLLAYWDELDEVRRGEVAALVERIPGAIRAGEWDALPLPDLGVLVTRPGEF